MYLRETFVVSIVTQFASYVFLAFQNLSSQICLKLRIKNWMMSSVPALRFLVNIASKLDQPFRAEKNWDY